MVVEWIAVVTWLILAAGVCCRIMRALRGKWLELVAVLVALVALAASVYIPDRIDRDNNTRLARATCFSSIISTRKALNTLDLGYDIAAGADDQRRADWEALDVELPNTQYGCHEAELPSWDSAELQRLIDEFGTPEGRTALPYPDEGYLRRIEKWTDTALKSLQSMPTR